MIDKHEILAGMPKADDRTIVNKRVASNADIINYIHKNLRKAINQTKLIAPKFASVTVEETAYNIWKFLKQHIKYQRDSDFEQNIRLPNAFVKAGTGDCKSYSLFTASILGNLNIPFVIRYASYKSDGIPSHVYVVAFDNNKPIVIDATIPIDVFGFEKPPKSKKDFKMNVNTITGVEGIGTRQRRGGLKKLANKIKAKEHTLIDKAKKGAKKLNIHNALYTIKKGALSSARVAVLALIRLNLHFLANKLNKMRQKNPQKLKTFWEKLGGNYASFDQAISVGNAKKGLFGIGLLQSQQTIVNKHHHGHHKHHFGHNKHHHGHQNLQTHEEMTAHKLSIGEPVTVASIITVATPILIAIINMLHKNNIKDKDTNDLGKSVTDANAPPDTTENSGSGVLNKVVDAVTNYGGGSSNGGGGSSNGGGGSPSYDGGGSSNGGGSSSDGGNSPSSDNNEPPPVADSGFKMSPLMIFGVVGAGALLLYSMNKTK